MITANVGNTNVKNAVKIFYDLVLNGIRTAEIYTDGSDSVLRSEYGVGSVVEIYKDGTLEFEGVVIETRNFTSGGIVMLCMGQEEELTEEESPTDTGKNYKVWNAENVNTIFSDLVTSVTGWNVNVTGSTDYSLASFRVSKSMSVWNSIIKFKKTTNKDFYIVDSTKTIYLVDKKNRTNRASFVEGKNCGNINFTTSKIKASKVVVYGKGDGESQFIGEAGSGKPVKKIVDRNIISDSEATERATKELALIQNSVFYYSFNCFNPNENVETGDTINLDYPSAGIFNSNVDIVKIRRSINNDIESLKIEVTDTNHRTAKDNQAKIINKIKNNYEASQTSMQGSGNTLTWGGGINAKKDFAAKIGFYIPPDFVEDNLGNINIVSLTLDYELDKYLNQFGDAEFTGSDPQVQNDGGDEDVNVSGNTGNEDVPVSGNTGNEDVPVSGNTSYDGYGTRQDYDTDTYVGSFTISSSYTTIAEINPDTSYTIGLYFWVTLTKADWSDFQRMRIKIVSSSGSTYYTDTELAVPRRDEYVFFSDGTYARDEHFSMVCFGAFIPEPTRGRSYDVDIKQSSTEGNNSESGWVSRISWVTIGDHRHSGSTLNGDNHNHAGTTLTGDNHNHAGTTLTGDNHRHPPGFYDIDSADLDYININSGVSESGAINSDSVDLYLQFWDGSDWITKNTILSTGKIFDQNVDLTDGGTYPDSAGWWRVLIEPNSTTPDFVSGIINIKHNLEN